MHNLKATNLEIWGLLEKDPNWRLRYPTCIEMEIDGKQEVVLLDTKDLAELEACVKMAMQLAQALRDREENGTV